MWLDKASLKGQPKHNAWPDPCFKNAAYRIWKDSPTVRKYINAKRETDAMDRVPTIITANGGSSRDLIGLKYETWSICERVTLHFKYVGSLAGVTYLRYTALMNPNKDETAVHCCDPALSVLVTFGVSKRQTLSRISLAIYCLLI